MQTGQVASSIARALARPVIREPIIGKLVVDNPEYVVGYGNDLKIAGERNLRDDPLGQMHDRKQVTEAQYKAGREWQKAYEAAGARMKSSGHLEEPVSGSRPLRDGVTDHQMQAMKRLGAYERALGPDGAKIVELVLGDKLSLRELANRRYYSTSRSTMIYVGRRWRECLDGLAVAMGFASAT